MSTLYIAILISRRSTRELWTSAFQKLSERRVGGLSFASAALSLMVSKEDSKADLPPTKNEKVDSDYYK